MHQFPTEQAELKTWKLAVLVGNAPQGSGLRVSTQALKVAEVAVIEMVDEAMLLWKVEKEPKKVLSFINDSESRQPSTYAMLVCYYKL